MFALVCRWLLKIGASSAKAGKVVQTGDSGADEAGVEGAGEGGSVVPWMRARPSGKTVMV